MWIRSPVPKDFSDSVAALLGYCSDLPDITPGERIAAGLGAVAELTGAVLADDPIEPAPAMDDLDEAKALERFDQAAAVFAVHYGLEHAAVWTAMYELEGELIEQGGLPWFGHLLSSPVGWTALGIRVAERVTGLDPDALPPPFMMPEREAQTPPPIVRTVRDAAKPDWYFLTALWCAGMDIAGHLGVPFEDVRQALDKLPEGLWSMADSPEGWGALSAHVSLMLGVDADPPFKPVVH
jgi:hypothetical protein